MNAAGSVLIIPAGRGSCSGSGVILEAIANGTAPAAIVLSQADPIICLGAILGEELYDRSPAVLVVSETERRQFAGGDTVTIDAQGNVTRRGPSNA
jgi:predicted aconitase with swiveling domain